jgi:hypothetical protein
MEIKDWPPDHEEYFWKELVPHYHYPNPVMPRYGIDVLVKKMKDKFPDSNYNFMDLCKNCSSRQH